MALVEETKNSKKTLQNFIEHNEVYEHTRNVLTATQGNATVAYMM